MTIRTLTYAAAAVIISTGAVLAADQQTNQPIPLADPGKTGPVPCYIMAPDKNGKWDRVLVRMHGKNPGGAIKDCTDLPNQ
jgi:hypothetical protein